METCKINLFKTYNSKISSSSKAFPNFSNSSSKLRLVSIKYTKLERDLQLILKSLRQFLLTKINLSKFSDCKQHLLRLARTPANESIFFVSIWDPTIPKIHLAQKPTIWNVFSCFTHHYSGHLMSLTST
jgi:hypothetical protein